MKQSVLSLLALLTLAAASLAAADFWEKKKFTEWDEKEVAKMLNDSPWVKTFSVYLKGFAGRAMGGGGGAMGGGGGGRGGGRGGMGGGGMGGGDMGGGDMGGGDMGGGGGDMGATMMSSGIPVTVRWLTALPVRQANVRLKLGEEAGTSPQAAETLAKPQQFYIVGISGIPAKAITVSPEELKSHAELRVKKPPAIQPVQVQVEQQRMSSTVYLIFPRAQEGAHQIVEADNEVEVFLQLEAGKISRKFKLKDMVFNGKLEL